MASSYGSSSTPSTNKGHGKKVLLSERSREASGQVEKPGPHDDRTQPANTKAMTIGG